MQNILDIKLKLETQAQMVFAEANQKYMEEQKILQEYLMRRIGYEKTLKEAMDGTIDVQAVTNARADLNAMKTLVRRQVMEVHKAERRLEDASRALEEGWQERKVQEKLREKAFEEFMAEENRTQAKEIDEVTSYVYGKNKTPKP